MSGLDRIDSRPDAGNENASPEIDSFCASHMATGKLIIVTQTSITIN